MGIIAWLVLGSGGAKIIAHQIKFHTSKYVPLPLDYFIRFFFKQKQAMTSALLPLQLFVSYNTFKYSPLVIYE